jgi:hypothetical protein
MHVIKPHHLQINKFPYLPAYNMLFKLLHGAGWPSWKRGNTHSDTLSLSLSLSLSLALIHTCTHTYPHLLTHTHTHSTVGTIAGASVGGLVLALLVCCLCCIIWYVRLLRKRKKMWRAIQQVQSSISCTHASISCSCQS